MTKPYSHSLGASVTRRTVLAGVAGVAAAAILPSMAFAQAKAIRISTPGAAEEWQSKALQKFKESLEAAAPGKFDVQIHYNGTLFGQGTEIEAMQRGNLEVGMISPQDIAALIPEYSIFTTGYLMRDAAHLDAVYDGEIGKEYKARVAKDLQLHIVRSQYLGSRQVMLRQPKDVKVPADLAGLKLRMPGSEAWQFLGNALGANATPLAFEEIYLALQTGTIDGLENPLPDIISNKFYEVAKQVVLTDHMVSNTFFTMSGPFWDGLTDEEKAAIEKAEGEAKAFNDEGVLGTEKEAVALLESKGVAVDDAGRCRPSARRCSTPSPTPTSPRPGLPACSSASRPRKPGRERSGIHCRGGTGAGKAARLAWRLGPLRGGHGGVLLRRHVRRLHHPDIQPLCAQHAGLVVAGALLHRLHLGCVLELRHTGQRAQADRVRPPLQQVPAAGAQGARHRQHRHARVDLPRGHAGRCRLHPFPRPADFADARISAWTWSIPAS